jgi:hypothetical protein
MFSSPRFIRAFLAINVLAGCTVLPATAAEDEGIVTDRPDFVESSNVVGRGRFQVETSVLAERARESGARIRTVSTPTLLRYGVGDTVELRLESDGRVVEHTRSGAIGSTAAGAADTSVGVKWHVLDGAPGVPSVGVLLHADLASGSDAFRGQGVRPSLRVAAEWDLPGGLALGLMPGVGLERNAAGGRYRYGIFGAVLGTAITPSVRGFVEVAMPQIARARNGGTRATFDAGAGWLLSERCQLDAMLAAGLNRRTPDVALTIGFSYKL